MKKLFEILNNLAMISCALFIIAAIILPKDFTEKDMLYIIAVILLLESNKNSIKEL